MCRLNLPTGAAYPPTVGTYKKAFADLTAKLPITQLSDPLGYNLTVCEGAGCSLFGVRGSCCCCCCYCAWKNGG